MNSFENEIKSINPLPLTTPSSENLYPIDALGTTLSAMAKELNAAIQSPTALCGQSVLMAAALICQGIKNVKMPHGEFPLSLFSLSIAESGERKTAIDKMAMAPIADFEQEQYVKYTQDVNKYTILNKAFVESEKIVTKSLAKNASRQEVETTFKTIGAPPKKPIQPTLTTSDATIEGVVRHFISALPILGIYSSEGGAFFGGHSMSKDNVTKAIALFSQGWDGAPLGMMRADPLTGVFKLYNKRLSINLMIQPVILEKVLSDPLLTAQGFIPRFLLCQPESTMGTRLYKQTDLCQTPGYKAYYSRLKELLNNGLVLEENTNDLILSSLTPTEESMSLYAGFHDEIERELSVSGRYRHVAGAASKIAEQSLRIAGVLTVIKYDQDPSKVNAEEMLGGIKLARYSLHELLRMESQANVSPPLNDAIILLDWCRLKEHRYIYNQLLQQFAPNSLRKQDRFLPAIKILISHGYLMPLESGKLIDDRHRKDVWQVLHYHQP